jgi:protein-tyrosine phosphatase
MIKVLFVCTGNICRSPTAEGVFRHMVKEAGLEKSFEIDSAGTNSGHIGQPPDGRAIATAKRHGISLEGQRARGLADSDFATFDYIYALDNGHLHEMQRRAPHDSSAQLLMFIEDQDVPDPWYGGSSDFEYAFGLIFDGCANILKQMRQEQRV